MGLAMMRPSGLGSREGVPTALGLCCPKPWCGHIARQPATGSPRYAHELDLPGLRCWPLRRYPYLVFYVELPRHVDVWRILHRRRDIPAAMLEEVDSDQPPR